MHQWSRQEKDWKFKNSYSNGKGWWRSKSIKWWWYFGSSAHDQISWCIVKDCQCLSISFQSKIHLWPFQLIISACSLSCFNLLSENEERNTNLNNTGLQLWILFSRNYVFSIFWGNSHERNWQEKVKVLI